MSKVIPINWLEVDLGDVLKLKNGFAFKSRDYQHSGHPVIRISDIQEGLVTTNKSARVEDFNSKYQINKGDILIAMSGATTGKYGIYMSDELALQNQRVGKFDLFSEKLVEKNYLFYYLANTRAEIEKKAYGGAQPNISTKLIENLKFPLAPLNEQKRIVKKLDAIFEKINQNKARLERIPQLLKDFRQQVLQAAVTGELTKEWREENEQDYHEDLSGYPENDFGWKVLKAADACIKVQSGSTPKNSPFTAEGDVPYLKVYNIQDQKIAFDYKPQFISNEIHTTGSMKRSIVKPNDVLMNIVGPPLGKIAIVTEQYPEWNINQAIVLFRPKPFLLTEFLYYSLCGGREIERISFELKGSAGQQNISLTQSRNFILDIPSIEEQKEIVSKVEELFAFADKIEANYLKAKTKIEHLPQTILAKAFRGELVGQDPNDEPASELLEKIMEAKKALKKKKK